MLALISAVSEADLPQRVCLRTGSETAESAESAQPSRATAGEAEQLWGVNISRYHGNGSHDTRHVQSVQNAFSMKLDLRNEKSHLKKTNMKVTNNQDPDKSFQCLTQSFLNRPFYAFSLLPVDWGTPLCRFRLRNEMKQVEFIIKFITTEASTSCKTTAAAWWRSSPPAANRMESVFGVSHHAVLMVASPVCDPSLTSDSPTFTFP
ncbi:uncharacterized protein V6R79_005771 [Siganus canaliculatus]